MRNKVYKILGLLFGLFWGTSVLAGVCVQQHNNIGLMGLDNPNGAVYASLLNHDGKCGCNIVRFTTSNTKTDKALAILLAAKTSKQKVRVDFLNEGDCNSGYRVYLQ